LRSKRNAICPYCRDPLAEGDQIVSCSHCRTLHHRQCWTSYQRCSIFGCPGIQTELGEKIETGWSQLDKVIGVGLSLTLAVLLALPVLLDIWPIPSPWGGLLFASVVIGAFFALTIWTISRTSECPACGADAQWNRQERNFSCPNCRSRFLPRSSARFPQKPRAILPKHGSDSLKGK